MDIHHAGVPIDPEPVRPQGCGASAGSVRSARPGLRPVQAGRLCRPVSTAMTELDTAAPAVRPPPLPDSVFPDPARAIAAPVTARIGPPLVVADEGWQDASPGPWRRYFGRAFDVLVLGTVLWTVLDVLVGVASPRLHDAVSALPVGVRVLGSGLLSTMLLIPISAVLIGTTGLTPGKWVFGTRITRPDGRPIGIAAAFGRELGVLVFGLGLGIPLVSIFTLIASNARLVHEHATRWDARRPWVVTHRPPGIVQMLMVAGGVVTFVLLRLSLVGIG